MTKYVELKIKIKSLADESKIIRSEKSKLLTGARYSSKPDVVAQRRLRAQSLHTHRVINVRNASRHSLLAYGYLRGVPYKVMESKCRNEEYFRYYHCKEIAKVINTFSESTDKVTWETVCEWSKQEVKKSVSICVGD